MIEKNPKIKGKIKLIGIGAKNDIYYVGLFKDQHRVPFPLFPDKNLDIHKLIGKPETPFFIGLKLKEKGKPKIFYTHLGPVPGGAAEFLKLIMKKSGLE
jgi:hypothetical protein